MSVTVIMILFVDFLFDSVSEDTENQMRVVWFGCFGPLTYKYIYFAYNIETHR